MRNANNTRTKNITSLNPTAAMNGSVIDVRKKKNGEGVCSFGNVASSIVEEIFPLVDQEEDSKKSKANSNGTDQIKGRKNTKSSSSSKRHQQKKQPLFAAVVQNLLLEERMCEVGVSFEINEGVEEKIMKNGAPKVVFTASDNKVDNDFIIDSLCQSKATSSHPSQLNCILDRFIDQRINDYEMKAIKGRDLQAFTAYLGQKLEEEKQMIANDMSVKSSSEIELEDTLPTIPIADVKSNLQQVNCACCNTVASHVNSWANNYQLFERNIVLKATNDEDERDDIFDAPNGVSIPVSTNYLDVDDDDPFAYAAFEDDDLDIEAGVQQPDRKDEQVDAASSLRLELRQLSSPKDSKRYLQIDPACTLNNEGETCAYPIDKQCIVSLVKCFIIPCGIGEVDFDNEDALTDEDIQFIKSRAESSEKEFVHHAFEMLQSLRNCKTELLDALEECSMRTIFDPRTSIRIRDVDEELNKLIKEIAQFLIRVTKYSCCFGWISEKPTPISILTKLWGEFDQLLVDLVKPALKVRGTETLVHKRSSKVPLAFCNTVVRDSHEQFIEFKIDKVDQFLNLLRREFLNRADWDSPTFLKCNTPGPLLRFCVFEAYSMRKHNISADSILFDEETIEYLNEMLDAKIGLPQVNKHTTLRVVELVEKDRIDRFKLAYKKVVEIVTKADARLTFQSSPDVTFLASAAEHYDSTRLDYELDEKKVSDSAPFLSLDYDDNQRNVTTVEDMTRALQKSGALWMQWIYIICMENYSRPPIKKFHINRELTRYMDGWVKNPCEGGGERKASIILATLLYRWLEAKFNEWHAELTREELLQEAMDLTTPQMPTKSSASSKKSKKKKSKKKKKVKDESKETPSSTGAIENSVSADRGDTYEAGKDTGIAVTVTEEDCIAEIIDASILHSSPDVGWTTVGAKKNAERDADTARDEEIARALQEQFLEEAKNYEAVGVEALSTKEINVETTSPIYTKETDKAIGDEKNSSQIKSRKGSKSQRAKANQANNDDMKIAKSRDLGIDNNSFLENRRGDENSIVIAQDASTARAATKAKDECSTRGTGVDANKSTDRNDIKAEVEISKHDTKSRDGTQKHNGVKKNARKKRNKLNKKKEEETSKADVNENGLSSTQDDEFDKRTADGNGETEMKQKDLDLSISTEQIQEYRPKIGVYDGDQFVDAETYLVSRMKEVQKKMVWL